MSAGARASWIRRFMAVPVEEIKGEYHKFVPPGDAGHEDRAYIDTRIAATERRWPCSSRSLAAYNAMRRAPLPKPRLRLKWLSAPIT